MRQGFAVKLKMTLNTDPLFPPPKGQNHRYACSCLVKNNQNNSNHTFKIFFHRFCFFFPTFVVVVSTFISVWGGCGGGEIPMSGCM